jgi:type I restriction enzyme S subunit
MVATMNGKREGWTRVAFGDVIKNVNTFVTPRELPAETPYLAGEHLDAGALRVARMGRVDDPLFPPTFKRWVEAGQTLLHSRSPDKIAVPDFAAVTGEKLFVLAPLSEDVLPGFVPLLLQSDAFSVYVRRVSRGSVNKYLNWTALKEYEFDLPPLHEQTRIMRIMNAVRSAAQNAEAVAGGLDVAGAAAVVKLLSPEVHPMRRFGEIAAIEKGVSYTTADYCEEGQGHPFLNLKSAGRGGQFAPDGTKWVTDACAARHRAEVGDLFIANTDLTPERKLVGAPFFYPGVTCERHAAFSMDLSRVSPIEDGIDTAFLHALLNLPASRAFMRRNSPGSTVAHLRVGSVPDLMVPVPATARERDEAVRVAQQFSSAASSFRSAEVHASRLGSNLLRSLM